jgi:hypothetical protein
MALWFVLSLTAFAQTVLLGNQTALTGTDQNTKGTAEAYYDGVAAQSGTAGQMVVDLAPANIAKVVQVAVYSDSTACGGKGAHCPGTMVASGMVTNAGTGRTTIPLSGGNIVAGSAYWRAIMGVDNDIWFMDLCCGAGAAGSAFMGSAAGLTTLPQAWGAGGNVHADGPLSGYVAGGGGASSSSSVSVTITAVKSTAPVCVPLQLTSNVTGTTNATVTWAVTSGTGTVNALGQFCPGARAETDTVTATSVADPTKSASVQVIVGGGSVTLPLPVPVPVPLPVPTTTPGVLAVSAVSFGSVPQNTPTTLPTTIRNTGGSPVNISRVNLSGTGFSLSGITPPLALTPGGTYSFNVTFTPTSTGAQSGTISFISDASVAPSIGLSGTGAAPGQLAINLASSSFGSVAVGTPKPMAATLSASGSSVMVTSASVSSPEFTLTGLPSLPITLNPGTTAPFTMTFTPQVSGATSATVSFTSNASSTPVSKTVTGSGTAAVAQQHSVGLSWTASTSTVTGYYVYRSSTSGGNYTKLISTPDVSTTYTDRTVLSGQTYFYVTTASASDGTESTYSNEVTAAIP